MVVREAELAALSRLERLVVGFLTYAEKTVISPIAVVVVIAVDTVGATAHLRLCKHKLVMAGLVKQTLALELFLVCHDLVRNVQFWAHRSLHRRAVVGAPSWTIYFLA